MKTTNLEELQPLTFESTTQDLPTLNDALGSLQADLEHLQSAIAHIDESGQAAQNAANAGRLVAQTAAGLVGPTTALVDRLDRVDFPSRLDKLDATVSALQVGFQTTQGRLDNVDRNLQEVVRRAEAATGERILAVQRAVDSAQGRLEALIAQHAANQTEALKQLRLLTFGALGGLIVLLALTILVFIR